MSLLRHHQLLMSARRSIACDLDTEYSGGASFPTEFTVALGTGQGAVILEYVTGQIPDKFEVWFDGVKVVDTGYVGDVSEQSALNSALAGLGLPPETITQRTGTNTPSEDWSYPDRRDFHAFYKSTSTTTATVRVYAPLSGTVWILRLSCPDNYSYAVFTEDGDFEVPSTVSSVDLLLIAGGGGGGATQSTSSNIVGRGGGGAGAVTRVWNHPVTPSDTIPVTVGDGGPGGLVVATVGAHRAYSGGDSMFGDNVISLGGGGGGPSVDAASNAGAGGGSGGGAGFSGFPTSNYVPGEGNAGGNMSVGANGGAGGGGFSSAGGSVSGGVNGGATGGTGSSLLTLGFAGASAFYAPKRVGGGGGGGSHSASTSILGGNATDGGGNGGTGAYGSGADAVPGTGGGGGGLGGSTGSAAAAGAAGHRGGNGGSGLVVVRYGPLSTPVLNGEGAATFDGANFSFEKNGDTPFLMASITKIMTLRLLVVHAPDLDDTTTVVDVVGGASAGLAPGDVISLRDLMYATGVVSGNEAATAIARYMGQYFIDNGGPGSSTFPITRFVQAMNLEASSLGCTNTAYYGPSGVSTNNNTQSAKDAARVMHSVKGYGDIVDALSTLSKTVTVTGGPNPRSINLTNSFDPDGMVKFPEWICSKTGSTGSTTGGYSLSMLWDHPTGGAMASVTLNSVGSAGAYAYMARYRDLRNLINYSLRAG